MNFQKRLSVDTPDLHFPNVGEGLLVWKHTLYRSDKVDDYKSGIILLRLAV